MTAEPLTLSDRARAAFLEALVHDDPIGLYDAAPCGFLTTTPDGVIVKANATFRAFVQRDSAEIVGTAALADLLTRGSSIYYGTHVSPALLMSGRIQEVALDLLRADGTRLPVLVNASVAHGDDGRPRAIRFAVFDATERRSYERELLMAKRRAEESERDARALARALQQTLVPPTPPVIPGLTLAAAYRPAGEGSQVGGDFYDVFRVGDDWVVTLGDVCGKGYEAAIVTSLVRHTIQALCVGEERPSAVLTGLDRVLHADPTERFCTAVLLRLRQDCDGWAATIALGGHPQPLLIRAGRPPEPAGAHGPLLGVVEDASYRDSVIRLGTGDALLLYTDGVTEGRRDQVLYGEARLFAAADRIGPNPRVLVDGLVEELLDFQGGTLRDDVAVVALAVSGEAR